MQVVVVPDVVSRMYLFIRHYCEGTSLARNQVTCRWVAACWACRSRGTSGPLRGSLSGQQTCGEFGCSNEQLAVFLICSSHGPHVV